MQLVVADTGPINYLILIGHIDLLPRLFDRIAIPSAVHAELNSERTPLPVQRWIASRPPWLEVSEVPPSEFVEEALANIDSGERAAIELACVLQADLLLMDDRKGVAAAQRLTSAKGPTPLPRI